MTTRLLEAVAMNKTVIGVTLILAVVALIGIYIYTESTRYEIVGSGTSVGYKIDRKTGETWILRVGGEEKLTRR